MLPEIDEATAKTGFAWTSALGGLAILWKVFFRGRRDLRDDHAAGVDADGRDKIISQLTAHVDRLDKAIADMGERLNAEMRLRYKAELEAENLRRRVAELEQEIAQLKLGRAGSTCQ